MAVVPLRGWTVCLAMDGPGPEPSSPGTSVSVWTAKRQLFIWSNAGILKAEFPIF